VTFTGAAAAMGRRLAESQMDSTGHFFDLGAPVTDPSTGAVTRPQSNSHSTVCRVRPATMRDYHSQAGGEELFASNYVIAIPFEASPAPQVKQHFVIDTSPDPALVGLELQIRQIAYGDHVTARRMLCYKVA
jgi:hypothetical protein